MAASGTASTLEITSILLTLSALFAWLNQRFLRLPTTIGLMVIALVASMLIVALAPVFPALELQAEAWLSQVDFHATLMGGMLGVLLFAGALHIDIKDLAQYSKLIVSLSTVGVVVSTFLVGTLIYAALTGLGYSVRYVMCLLFGSLISPTDPIAVLGILKTIGAPKELSTKIAGESLFNDGVGVVVFLAIYYFAGLDPAHADMTMSGVVGLFIQEAIGGALFGFIAGYVTYRLLRSIDAYSVEVLLTLALVVGGYTLAMKLHLSGPIAMVIAGLLIGNRGRRYAMSDATRSHLDTFWELVDEVLNAVLFVLIGLELILFDLTVELVLLGVLAIPLVLLSRFGAIAGTITALRQGQALGPHISTILTWSGLRGGISVALALSIPRTVGAVAVPERDLIVAMTYVVVVFSILVQGMTVGPLIRRLRPSMSG